MIIKLSIDSDWEFFIRFIYNFQVKFRFNPFCISKSLFFSYPAFILQFPLTPERKSASIFLNYSKIQSSLVPTIRDVLVFHLYRILIENLKNKIKWKSIYSLVRR